MRWYAWFWSALIAGALGLAAHGDARLVATSALRAGMWWWLASLGLMVIAAGLGDRQLRTPDPAPRWRRADSIALATVLGLALLTRLWRITEYPPPDAFAFEEFQTGGNAYRFLHLGEPQLEFPLTNTLPALAFTVIGYNAWALRVPFLASGIAAPLLLFLAMRRIVCLPAAWAAAALLASARWPAAAARFADEIFFPISVVALALWLLVRAAQRWRQLDLLLCALAMLDLFYSYTAYRAFPVVAYGAGVLAALWVWWGRRGRNRRGPLLHPLGSARDRPPPLRGGEDDSRGGDGDLSSRAPRAGSLQRLVLVAAVWAALIGPGVLSGGQFDVTLFAEAFRRHADGRAAAPPETRTVVSRATQALALATDGVRVFLSEGDSIPSVNIPGEPMLDRVSGPLVLLAVAAAVWRWRRPWRAALLAAVVLPFAGLAVFPTNLNVSRYFILLVPLYALVGCAADDLLRWKRSPAWMSRVLAVGVAGLATLNLFDLQRLIAHPEVRDSFLVAENTVLAAVHQAPRGARVVMITMDGSNAFEPSDYRWYSFYQTGTRPHSLAEALTVASVQGPIRWVTQGEPETRLLPRLVALVCPDGDWQVRRVPDVMATVATVDVPSGRQCQALPPVGLAATYRIEDRFGVREKRQVDPALMVHTIPWPIATQLQEERASDLRVAWRGMLTPPVAGQYEVRLEIYNATATLRVGDDLAQIPELMEHWQSASVIMHAGSDPLPIGVDVQGHPGRRPLVRLFWRPPGKRQDELVPPQVLRPM